MSKLVEQIVKLSKIRNSDPVIPLEVYSELTNIEKDLRKIDMVTLSNYVRTLDFMTTKEFCEQHGLPLPVFTGDVKTSATAFLQIDAIKFRLIKEYAKTLKDEDDMYSNMQYYMEYCESNGYVTPMDWLAKHKHY